jgi:hypothetical protein
VQLADVRVSVPAEVQAFDSAAQTVDAKPLVKQARTKSDGSRVVVDLPIITRVPVLYNGNGRFRVVFPLAPGDTVLLVFSDRSLDRWFELGGEVDPRDPRHHHLSDAVAIPCVLARSDTYSDVPSAGMKIGLDGGSAQIEFTDAEIKLADGVAGAARVGDKTAGHTHVVVIPPGGVGGVVVTSSAVDAIAEGSAKVKIG